MCPERSFHVRDSHFVYSGATNIDHNRNIEVESVQIFTFNAIFKSHNSLDFTEKCFCLLAILEVGRNACRPTGSPRT